MAFWNSFLIDDIVILLTFLHSDLLFQGHPAFQPLYQCVKEQLGQSGLTCIRRFKTTTAHGFTSETQNRNGGLFGENWEVGEACQDLAKCSDMSVARMRFLLEWVDFVPRPEDRGLKQSGDSARLLNANYIILIFFFVVVFNWTGLLVSVREHQCKDDLKNRFFSFSKDFVFEELILNCCCHPNFFLPPSA